MEYYISEIEIRNYLKLPQGFDNWSIVDQDSGFDKIFKIFPADIYVSYKDSGNDSEKEIFRLLTKAATHYAFIFSLPRIKTHITNFGIIEFTSDKTKASAWWDVRDLGLSLLKEADSSFSKAITMAKNVSEIYSTLPFFQEEKFLIETPEEFEKIYSINNSVDVFLNMKRFLRRAYNVTKSEKFKNCSLEEIANTPVGESLKQAIVYYALGGALRFPQFLVLKNAVVMQYDELPWQKSAVLSSSEILEFSKNAVCIYEENLKDVTDYVKENTTDFPCYTEPASGHIESVKSSGLYLL